jgi:hypothetical protein
VADELRGKGLQPIGELVDGANRETRTLIAAIPPFKVSIRPQTNVYGRFLHFCIRPQLFSRTL